MDYHLFSNTACKAWVTASIKPMVEDSSVIDAGIAKNLHYALVFPRDMGKSDAPSKDSAWLVCTDAL